MTQILLATNNADKLRELQVILKEFQIELVGFDRFPGLPPTAMIPEKFVLGVAAILFPLSLMLRTRAGKTRRLVFIGVQIFSLVIFFLQSPLGFSNTAAVEIFRALTNLLPATPWHRVADLARRITSRPVSLYRAWLAIFAKPFAISGSMQIVLTCSAHHCLRPKRSSSTCQPLLVGPAAPQSIVCLDMPSRSYWRRNHPLPWILLFGTMTSRFGGSSGWTTMR